MQPKFRFFRNNFQSSGRVEGKENIRIKKDPKKAVIRRIQRLSVGPSENTLIIPITIAQPLEALAKVG